jgi:hypothetical protein
MLILEDTIYDSLSKREEMFSTYDNCEVLMLNWHLDRLINIPLQFWHCIMFALYLSFPDKCFNIWCTFKSLVIIALVN